MCLYCFNASTAREEKRKYCIYQAFHQCTIILSHQWRIRGGESAAAPPPPPFFWPIFVFLADFFFSFRARHRGIWIPGPPFSQILDPPLVTVLLYPALLENRAFSRDVMLSSNVATYIAMKINIHLCKHLFTLLCVTVSPWISPLVVEAHGDRVRAWCAWLPWISRSVCVIWRPCWKTAWCQWKTLYSLYTYKKWLIEKSKHLLNN